MNKKNVWLINPYGPIEGESWREYRFNQFGKYLSTQGFNVVWWTSNFSHHFKQYRSDGWKDIKVNNNYYIRLVPSTSYKKNFGIGRFIKDIVFAKNAYKKFTEYSKPDIVITNNSPLLMGYPDFKYCNKYKVPIIADQMDLWPEFIEQVIGKPFSKILHLLFKPIYHNRKRNYDKLSGCIALGENYLKKMFDISPALMSKPNALIYNGIDVKAFRNKNITNREEDGILRCIFAGTLGPSYDVGNILKCAQYFDENFPNKTEFIIAGSGPLEEEVKNMEKKLANLQFLGKLLPEDLIPIYSYCDVGLSTYSEGSNVDMPDKFYDYTAGGLIVVNSLNGEIKKYIEKYHCGVNYQAGDFSSLKGVLEYILQLEDKKIYQDNAYEIAMLFDKNVQNEKLLVVINEVLKGSYGERKN